jgi:hypothetical protein
MFVDLDPLRLVVLPTAFVAELLMASRLPEKERLKFLKTSFFLLDKWEALRPPTPQ